MNEKSDEKLQNVTVLENQKDKELTNTKENIVSEEPFPKTRTTSKTEAKIITKNAKPRVALKVAKVRPTATKAKENIDPIETVINEETKIMKESEKEKKKKSKEKEK